MSVVRTILAELAGLFVDDGSFALAIIAWVLGGVLCIRFLGIDPVFEAVVLFLGLGALLVENVWRSARRLPPRRHPDAAC